MNFLFWNIYKKDLSEQIYQLCVLHDIDVLMLCECTIKSDDLLKRLNHSDKIYTYNPITGVDNIKIFTKFETRYIHTIGEENRITARNIALPDKDNITLIVAHFSSKTHQNEYSQYADAVEISRFVTYIEKQQGHNRTILCGDFNMNPFEIGMVQANGLHTVMEKQIALKMNRIIKGKIYPFFYNPMWGFLGDLGRGNVSGTHYYTSAQHVSYHWHLFDQIIMRPELIPIFDDNSLDIITKINNEDLLSRNGIINKTKFSDHLPIKFTFNI